MFRPSHYVELLGYVFMSDKDEDSEKKLSLVDVAISTCAAALGAQSSKNRKRDFSKGNPLVFVVSGVIFTIAFVLIIVGIVQLVI